MNFTTSNLKARIGLSVSLLIAVVFTCAGSLIYSETRASLVEQTISSHQYRLNILARALESQYQRNLEQSRMLLTVLLNEYLRDGHFNGETVTVDGNELAQIEVDGQPITNNALLDKFSRDTGFKATVFVPNKGDLVSLASSLLGSEGKRYVGFTLAADTPVVEALNAGEEFHLRSTVDHRDYLFYFAPVRDAEHQLIGALALTIDLTDFSQQMFSKLEHIAWGDTGYSIVFDASAKGKGTYLHHPIAEDIGQNVIVRANAQRPFHKLFEQPAGVITYPHTYLQHSGEKYLAFQHVKGWDWVLAGGTFVSEINKSNSAILNLVVAVVVFSAAAMLVLLYMVLSRLLMPVFKNGKSSSLLLDAISASASNDTEVRQSNLGRGIDGIQAICAQLEQLISVSQVGFVELTHQQRNHSVELEQLVHRIEQVKLVLPRLTNEIDSIDRAVAADLSYQQRVQLQPELEQTFAQLQSCIASIEQLETFFNDAHRLAHEINQLFDLSSIRGSGLVIALRGQQQRLGNALQRLRQ